MILIRRLFIGLIFYTIMKFFGLEFSQKTILLFILGFIIILSLFWYHSYAISIEFPQLSFPCTICH
jgi:hypothetical protein